MPALDSSLFDTPVHLARDVYRNHASLRHSTNLFARVADDQADVDAAIAAELRTRPRSEQPLIQRPFERWYGVVGYPFEQHNWGASRYTDGSYGVWYGSQRIETTVAETVHHFVRELTGRGQHSHDRPIVRERCVRTAYVDALLFDLCGKEKDFPGLVATDSYALTHQVGRSVHDGHHPGLLAPSARLHGGVNVDVFSPRYLSRPRDCCYLTYRYLPGSGRVEIERQPGTIWMTL